MNNSWDFGWEAVGAIFGILAFVGFLVVEWDKIKEAQLIPVLISICVSVLYGTIIGFTILQTITWRLIGLTLGILYGILIGVGLSDQAVIKGKFLIIMFFALVGIVIGLWIGS